VDTLSTSLEETQARTTRNETRISELDVKADAAGRSATEARTAADAASVSAKAADTRAEAVGTRVEEVSTAVEASRRLIYEVTLTEDQGNFRFGAATLPDDAKARLDLMVTQLKTEPTGAFIEIEGHADNTGDAVYNEHLGLERAETGETQ
jgi:outer membrane protein OmpA-like peptidoglycan-associated protein